MSSALCPSHVMRRPDDDTGRAQVAAGCSSGSGDWGTRAFAPRRSSRMIGSELPLSAALTSDVL